MTTAQLEERLYDAGLDHMSVSWRPIDLGPTLRGEEPDLAPTILADPNGRGLFYPGAVCQVCGPPGSGKGWLVLAAAKEQLDTGASVLYLDFEERAAVQVARLRSLGVPDEVIEERFLYVRPDEPLGPADAKALANLARETGASLAVVDGITEAMTLQGLDLNSNQDAATFSQSLPGPLADAGLAVVVVDHVTKNNDGKPSYSIGAQHKLAKVTASYALEQTQPMGRGQTGQATITVQKDRHGYRPARTSAGVLVVTEEDGRVTATLEGQPNVVTRSDQLRKRITDVLSKQPEPVNQRKLESMVFGNAADIREQLDWLITNGFIHVERRGKAKLHTSLRLFEPDEEQA